MEWQHPEWLYLILPLGAAWLALALYSRRRRRQAAEAFVAQAMWARILPPDSPLRFWTKTLLREFGLIAGLVALAGPRFGTQYEEVIPRGSDLYVLIDVSRSMLATDVPPSRLGRAKADVAALVNRLQGERVGLIAFAGQAVVKCPLTVDYDAFRRTLDELDPGSAPRGGTAIGDAIRKALEVFDAKAERDQAILVITDGDDQQSYPLEAAAAAAERHVTIFTVGLGDADHGARIPQGVESKTYVEYEGQQVWSKLNGSLLEEIALKTSGIYVPVGTRAYDLGEFYVDYLQGRRGIDTGEHKRIRRAEQFQVFLALALFALLADLFTRLYQVVNSPKFDQKENRIGHTSNAEQPRNSNHPQRFGQTTQIIATALVLVGSFSGICRGDDPHGAVREGLRLYEQDEFDKARDKFSAAREEFETQHAEKAAIAAFDEACAAHRKGDTEHARESYLKAGLAHDRQLAAAAHFNLGTLAAEEARHLAGEKPETVAAEKRQEILDNLKGAVASFRHSLELQPENARARRDIELVRQWIKCYTDKWREHDRQKRRDESNLLAFLEFLIQAQTALSESVKSLPATAPADAFAELKRAQDELQEEIVPLREKVRAELQPQQIAGQQPSPADSKELEEGIALLESWVQAAGEKMSRAARQLSNRQATQASEAQQAAIDELDKIWEAVIPFHPLLARDLADQTLIASALKPEAPPDDATSSDESPDANESLDNSKSGQGSEEPAAGAGHPQLASDWEETVRLFASQERTLRRTQLLRLKAEAELDRLEKTPPTDAAPDGDVSNPGADDAHDADASDQKPKPVDPEEIKAGYRKAIELAPQAVEQMQLAAKILKAKDRRAAFAPAEEARKILETIQKAQPKNEPPPQKKDDKKEEEKQQDQKTEEQKKREQEQQQNKKDQDKSDQEKNSDTKKQDQPQQVSRDRIEDALRKVRERQQEKRDRDRKMKARVMGRSPVDKDW